MKSFVTHSAQDTIKLASHFSRSLKKGDVVALYGTLGSGKTTFVKGIGSGLGVGQPEKINSPTFIIAREYEGRLPLYHIDLYRLNGLKEIENIAIEEYIYGDGVTVIEWPERMSGLLPAYTIAVTIKIKSESEREIRIEDFGD